MADGYLPGDGGYIYSPTEPCFIFPLLRDHCTSPYLDDLDIEAQRLRGDPKPSCPDERSPLLDNPASPQQTVSKRFDFGLSKLLVLWSLFGGSCFGREIAEIQDVEELERKYEAQSRELDGMRRERDNLQQSLKQERNMCEQKLESLGAKHTEIIDQKEAEWNKSLETASSQLQDEQSKAEAISSQLQDEISKVAAVSTQLQEAKSKLEKISSQLKDEKSKVAQLQKHIEKNETVVTRAHETHVSSLSKSVSRPFTDDMIKYELKCFYQNDFLSWCGDLSSMEVDEPEKAMEKLQSMGIINNSKSYMNEPANLQFSMDLPDGRSPVVLLQAVLSHTLCDTFLRDAYFLADGMETSKVPGQNPGDRRRWLKELEDMLCKVDKNFGIDWRIQTVQSLEKATPFNLHLVQNKAKNFVQDFHFLLKQVDAQALQDLSQLFFDFGSMALKFWKTRTVIKTHGMSRFAHHKFDAESPFIEADVGGSPAARRRLQGRHVGVVVRPLIVSEPLGQDEEVSREVVWLKAAGWVSDYEEVVDTPEEVVIDDGGGGDDDDDDGSDEGDDEDVMRMMMTMMMTMTL